MIRAQPLASPGSSKRLQIELHASNAVISRSPVASSFLHLFGLLKRLKLECALENALRLKYARRLGICFREVLIGRDIWRSA